MKLVTVRELMKPSPNIKFVGPDGFSDVRIVRVSDAFNGGSGDIYGKTESICGFILKPHCRIESVLQLVGCRSKFRKSLIFCVRSLSLGRHRCGQTRTRREAFIQIHLQRPPAEPRDIFWIASLIRYNHNAPKFPIILVTENSGEDENIIQTG